MGALRRVKTKRRTRYDSSYFAPPPSTSDARRDYDQVLADLASAKHLAQYHQTKDPEDLPALGRHYCVECSKWFESEHNLRAHVRGKNHKRRYTTNPAAGVTVLRLLKEEPHSQKLAEAVVGLTTNNGARNNAAAVTEAIEVEEGKA
ncbi:Bud site selection protein 20, partial [Ascosphaera acerosa]